MTDQKKATKQAQGEEKQQTFETVHQMASYYFPETDANKPHPNGNERGGAVAERVFTEVTHSSSK